MIQFLLRSFLYVTLVRAGCYEPNFAHPLPDYDAKDAALASAFALLDEALTTAVSSTEFIDTSFSIEVTSSKESLWSRHHTALVRNISRPDIPEVNGDALYRIASISKTFTVLGILYQHVAGNLSLDDSVDKYIEELRGEQDGSLTWNDITLRSLASQLSGIPRDFAQVDLINWFPPEELAEKLGLPPLSRKGLPKCDEYAKDHSPPCTRYDLIDVFKSRVPIFAPNQKSTYSNIAFELLGIVIQETTNQTFESYIDDAIFKPLEMEKSTFLRPPDSDGVIPLNPHYWDYDAGIQNPTGGIYSSTNDLSKYLRYILTHYNGITSALNWVHVVSAAEGLHSFYGTPWEIFRTDKVLLNSRRPVSFITKGGGLPGYTSVIMTVPEYDLGITILVAGKSKLYSKLQELVTVQIIRAAEEVAIKQLKGRYAGTYISADAGRNSSLQLVADHRGLVVTDFISNSTDILKSPLPGLGGAPDDQAWYAQLVPTLLYRNESQQAGERWRLLFITERDDENHGVWDDFCITNIDLAGYAAEPLNEFDFWLSKGEGIVESVDLRGFRVNLDRKKEEENLDDDCLEREIRELLENQSYLGRDE